MEQRLEGENMELSQQDEYLIVVGIIFCIALAVLSPYIASGDPDGGPADGDAPAETETEKRQQPKEAAVLYRSFSRRSGGACSPRYRPVYRHPEDAGGRCAEGLYPGGICRQRLPVCAGDPVGYGEQIYRRRRRRTGTHQTEQAGRHGVGKAEIPCQSGCEGSGQGAHRPVCPARPSAGICVFAGFPVAEGV